MQIDRWGSYLNQEENLIQFTLTAKTIALTFHRPLKLLCQFLRNSIPKLRSSKMDVVDGIQISIFNMPSKGSSPHSEIEVRGDDSWDFAGFRCEAR